jgi:hypothetical protein
VAPAKSMQKVRRCAEAFHRHAPPFSRVRYRASRSLAMYLPLNPERYSERALSIPSTPENLGCRGREVIIARWQFGDILVIFR